MKEKNKVIIESALYSDDGYPSQMAWLQSQIKSLKHQLQETKDMVEKLYEIADEIEDWLGLGRRMKCYKCDEGELQTTPLSPPDEGYIIGCNKCNYLGWFPTIEDVYNDILFGNKRGEKNVSK